MSYEMKYVGKKGPLNSEIIAISETSVYGNYGVMLAKRLVNNEVEYATWEFSMNCENEPSCYWGHYTNDFDWAMIDFVKRTSELLGVDYKMKLDKLSFSNH